MENNKKHILNLITKIMTVLLCLTLIAGCVSNIRTGGKPLSDKSETQQTEQTTKPAKKGSTKANLVCAGDNLIHLAILNEAKSRAKDGTFDFTYAYENIKDIISGADLAFLNQEVAIVPSKAVSSYPLFNSPPQLLDHMIDIGFDVFNQSTNHILDMGIDGTMEDLKLFESKDNIILTGLYKTWDDMFKPETIVRNDITFSFCGFTQYLNGLTVPTDSDLGLVYLTDTRHTEDELYSTMEKMIQENKKASDICCVSMHWMIEDVTTPTEPQRAIAEKLANYGADIIIGTGPHVLQPIEYITRTDGSKALVIWSLGNFISTQANFPNVLGGIADVTVEKNYETGKTTVSDVGFIPTLAHYEYGKTNVRIMPFSKYTNELALAHGSGNLTYDSVDKYYKEMFGDYLKK